MGPVESNPDRYAGAWRLLIWAPLLVLAVASRFVLPSSWAGLVALWGWAPLVVGVAAVWAVVGFLGVREWRRHTDRLESIPIRIHVDGSRGKTGTCRLIGAALRANGLRVVVKTTGKMPVLIDAAGKETVLERPPTPTENLREQKDIVRWAMEQHAQAIVIECMAVDPELRRVSQETLIRATLAVITNIRRDHLEVIGPDLGTGARTLSDVIPRNGRVITAEQRLLPTLRDEAEKRHASLIAVSPDGVSDPLLESFPYITFKENVALALGVCEVLGLDRARALEGMFHSTPDYGTVQLFERQNHAGVYTFVCALGVNDVDSLLELRRELIRRKKLDGGPLVGLFNSREDPMVTLGVSVLVLQTAVFVGIAVSMFWYERSLLSPGGVVVPGYVALFLLLRPEVVAYTLAIALTTAALMRYASRFTILFGRRRFAITMLAAMSLSIAIELIVGPFTGLDPGFQVIGFIIPGLIANEVLRQKIIPTLSTLGIVSAITAGITILLVGFW